MTGLNATCRLRSFVVLAVVGLLPAAPATGQDLLEATISPAEPGTGDVVSIDVFGRFSCGNYQLVGPPEIFVDGSTVVIDLYYVAPGGCLPVLMDFQTKGVDVSEDQIRVEMDRQMEEAMRQLAEQDEAS